MVLLRSALFAGILTPSFISRLINPIKEHPVASSCPILAIVLEQRISRDIKGLRTRLAEAQRSGSTCLGSGARGFDAFPGVRAVMEPRRRGA